MYLKFVIDFLKEVNELQQAKSLLDTFQKYAKTLIQYDELGMLYEKVKAYHSSLQMLEKCLELSTNDMERQSIYANLAKVYNHVNDAEKSLYYSGLILKQKPNDYESLMEQSFSYYLLGNTEKSYEIQSELLKNPHLPENVKKRITFNMGTFEMSKGNFKEGIRNMIFGGKEIGIWKQQNRPYQKWDGNPTNKLILIFAEAGIGDEIINVRFLKELEKRNLKHIWLGGREETVKLFKDNGFNCVSIKDYIPKEECVWCDSMSLPVLLGLDKHELWYGEYLKPKAEYIEKWKKILPEQFVTIKWSGNPYYDQDLHRSVDKDLLTSKLKECNIPIISLQMDEINGNSDLINVDIKSWDDTLAIQHLALLNITSCTSTAHSAGASGAKCVVLPPIATYFPWLNLKEDNTSHWYGKNLKCFPQKKHKHWEETINLAIEELNVSIKQI